MYLTICSEESSRKHGHHSTTWRTNGVYYAAPGGSAVIRTTAVPNQEKEKNTLSREPREQFSMLILD